MLLDKKLFLAPITPNPQRILDLGTGTGKLHFGKHTDRSTTIITYFSAGIWSIDMAEKYPSAEVSLSNALHFATCTSRA